MKNPIPLCRWKQTLMAPGSTFLLRAIGIAEARAQALCVVRWLLNFVPA
jgi:hypothetical protein